MDLRKIRPILLAAATLYLVVPAGAQQGSGNNEAKEEAAGPGIEIPLVGRVPLPGFMASWFGKSGDASNGQGGAAGQNAQPPAVIVQTVQTQSVGDSFDFIGTITPIEQVGIRARVEGYIERVAFEGGQNIKEGDLLFQIEPAQYQASVKAAEAQLSGAQATLNQAQRDFDRQQGLTESGVTARATLDTARANLENAQAQFLQAQAALTQAQLNLGYTQITAPIDGEISAPLITRGNYVSSSTGDLANLIQMNPIWGVFPIGENQLATWQRVGITEGDESQPPIEADAGQTTDASQASGSEGGDIGGGEASPGGEQTAAIGSQASSAEGKGAEGKGAERTSEDAPVPTSEGTAAEAQRPVAPDVVAGRNSTRSGAATAQDFVLKLRLPDGSEYDPAGEFDFVGNSVNPTTGTVDVRIAFPNPDRFLLANQNVTLVASEKNPPTLPVVPQAAIQLSREGRSVLLVKPDNTIERRPITVGKQVGAMTAVTNGLQGGETVVVRGSASVQDGTKVTPRTEAEMLAQQRQNAQSRDPAGGQGQSGSNNETGAGATGGAASQGAANSGGSAQSGAGQSTGGNQGSGAGR